MADDVQVLCARGQAALATTDYIEAERLLTAAEKLAWDGDDFDALARLYMPLQEARRQIRQRAGEGTVRLDLVARGPDDALSIDNFLRVYPHGQLLIAGWASIAPAVVARKLAAERGLFVDVFLAAAYQVGEAIVVLIPPNDEVALPPDRAYTIDTIVKIAPPHALVMPLADLPAGARAGTPETFAETMLLFETLHAPFLAAADMTSDLRLRMAGYRQTIRVDSACELAHQRLSDTAHALHRARLRAKA